MSNALDQGFKISVPGDDYCSLPVSDSGDNWIGRARRQSIANENDFVTAIDQKLGNGIGYVLVNEQLHSALVGKRH
jgi:hypothetical protein